jgi:hypothetical protein
MTSARPYRKTPLSHEIAIGELRKYSGIQFDPEIVPILIGLDREILDRRPERPDELPTMLHAGTPREPATDETPETAESPETSQTPESAETTEGGTPPSRPMLASDDVS